MTSLNRGRGHLNRGQRRSRPETQARPGKTEGWNSRQVKLFRNVWSMLTWLKSGSRRIRVAPLLHEARPRDG